ncbi:MAG: hypothetical protein MUP81_06475 [Dehalococcoidia bacterium]|nr:hypothetical protein [Dehalococcoidia bacterium]
MLKEISENPEAIKTLVRPILTGILAIGWIVIIVVQANAPWYFHATATSVLLEYAGERAFMRLRDMLGYKNGK